MKKFFFLSAFVILSISVIKAQDLNKDAALKLINGNAEALGINNFYRDVPLITNAYTDADRGITYIYPQQTYKGIKLFNIIKSVIFKETVLQTFEGDFINKIENKTNSEVPVITASDAVVLAAKHLGLSVPNNLKIIENNYATKKQYVLSNAGIAKRNTLVELVWRSNDDNQTFQLAWNVSIDVLNSSDYWNVRVDAATGTIIDKDNYTVHENKTINTTTIKKNNKINCVEQKFINPDFSAKLSSLSSATTSATYRVVAFPKENKNVTGGITLETDPWLKVGATNNAVTYGWHYDGTIDYDFTQGNNVFAYDDSLKQNFAGRYPTSSTPFPTLTFTPTPVFTKQPTLTQNREFGTTNLFYWNNIIHDIYYQYGFTEAGGNFQSTNFGVDNNNRGGAGGDLVMAEAQDGGGTNNANFSTPPDGSSGRMQMYLWTPTTIRTDGDIDNGIITHEFGHGISNRLTGGPSNTSCLSNYEQAGEGWSDYFALMTTTNWATAKTTDGTKKRPVGTYVMNQTLSGAGIREFPYTTDMNINFHTYVNVGDVAGHPGTTSTGVIIPNSTEIHYIGEVWCSALWDMTWNIIQQVGYINPNIYDANGGGGNNIALNLVMQGLKFQKCSPGFLDSRNAILKADSVLYGNMYHCAIWNAFGRRGMGYNAIQGLSTKTTDQTEDFEVPCFTLSGRVITPNLLPVNNALVWNKKDNYFWNAKDSANAYFEFDAYTYFNKTLFAAKKPATTKANGVTSVDVLLTQRHILNTTKLSSAYKIIAADVDGNKVVNSVDVLRIKRLILGTDTTFTKTVGTVKTDRLWEFVDSAYVFPDTTNPFPFKDSIKITTLNANVENQTFIGVKLGDVNYDWKPAIARGVSIKPVELMVNGEWVVANGEKTLNLKLLASNFTDIAAMQYTLHFDNSKYEFVGIKNNNLNIDFNSNKANETGNIAMLWTDKNGAARTLEDGSNLFILQLKPKQVIATEPELTLVNDIADIEAWDNDYRKHNIVLTKQRIVNNIQAKNEFVIYPNPAKGLVNIAANNAKQVSITDYLGRMVHKQNINNQSSVLSIKLQKGVYVVQVILNDGNIATQKLIIE